MLKGIDINYKYKSSKTLIKLNRFSTERKSKHNGSRHQSRQRKVKPKTSINSGGQVPSWAQSGAGQHSSNISLLLDQLLLGYDSHVRPNFGGMYNSLKLKLN